MVKKWKRGCIIGVAIVLVVLWLLRPQKLSDIVDISSEDVCYGTLYTYTDDEDWRRRDVRIEDKEA